MSAPLDDRLRSYYRDRTEREPLPGSDEPEEHMARVIAEADARSRPRVGPGHDWPAAPVRIAAVAALVLAVLGVGLVLVSRQEEPGPSTGPDPDGEQDLPVTTTTPSTMEQDGTGTDPRATTSATGSTTTTTGDPAGTARTSVVASEGELGGWDGEAWVRVDEGWDPTAPGEGYRVVHLDGTVTEATSTVRTAFCTGDDDTLLDVGIRGADPSTGGVGVSGVASPVPRPVEQLDPSGEVYRTATRDLLADLGVDDPAPDVRQVVRADLDGDGADEVVVVARRFGPESLFQGSLGDYAIVYVREAVDDQVETVVVRSLIVTSEQRTVADHEVAAVADLNGDGRMELVLGVGYYESAATVVHEMGDGQLPEVLAKGCGP